MHFLLVWLLNKQNIGRRLMQINNRQNFLLRDGCPGSNLCFIRAEVAAWTFLPSSKTYLKLLHTSKSCIALFRTRRILPVGTLRHASPIFKMLSITLRIHAICFSAFILSHGVAPFICYYVLHFLVT